MCLAVTSDGSSAFCKVMEVASNVMVLMTSSNIISIIPKSISSVYETNSGPMLLGSWSIV